MTSKTIDLVVDRLSAVRCGALGRRMAQGRQAAEAFRQVFADLGIFFAVRKSRPKNRSSAALRIPPSNRRQTCGDRRGSKVPCDGDEHRRSRGRRTSGICANLAVHRRSTRFTTSCGSLISSMTPLLVKPPRPWTSNTDGSACRPADGAVHRPVRRGLRVSHRW